MMPTFCGEMTRKVRQSTGEVRQVRPCRHRVPVRRIMGRPDDLAGCRFMLDARVIDAPPRARLRSAERTQRTIDERRRDGTGDRIRQTCHRLHAIRLSRLERSLCPFQRSERCSVRRTCFIRDGGRHRVDLDDGASLVDGVMHIGAQLRDALANDGKKFRVALFRANSRFSYRMDYEWNDHARWNITKLGGASGRPDGLEALDPLD